MNWVSVRWLLHNTVAHPVAGVLWFTSDVTGWQRPGQIADALHSFTLGVEK